MQQIKPLEWNNSGYSHTLLGVFFQVIGPIKNEFDEPPYFILERYEGSLTSKSFHHTSAAAKQHAHDWLQKKINATLAVSWVDHAKPFADLIKITKAKTYAPLNQRAGMVNVIKWCWAIHRDNMIALGVFK